MRKIIILSVVALVPSICSADAIVRIRSDQPANAYLDGKLAGSAPLTISKMKSGSHTVKIENAQTGEIKIFSVNSPKGATAEKDIDVSWEGAPVVQQTAEYAPPTTEYVQTTVVQDRPVVPVVVAQPVVYRPYYGRGGYRDGGYGNGGYSNGGYNRYDRDYLRQQQEARDKVRSRNVLLGGAVANELLNKGNSKGLVRGVTVGGALLNEVLRSGR